MLSGDLPVAEQERAALLAAPSAAERAWGHILASLVARLAERDTEQALGCLETATALDPTNTEAWHYLASTQLLLGEWAGARTLAQRVLRAHPDSLRDVNLLGEIAWHQQRWDEATAWFERGLARGRAPGALLCNLGSVSLARGHPYKAAGYLRQAIAAAPALLPPYIGLGRALESSGQWQLAAEQYERALELDPSSETALSRLVALRREHGQPEAAWQVALHYGLKEPGSS